ncbi:MAG: PFL_4695 family integrating conjugative element protein [Gammaproteobacteria bacterium]
MRSASHVREAPRRGSMRRWFVVGLLAAAGEAAALEVIHDGGGEPIGPYLARLVPPDAHAIRRIRAPSARPDRAYSLKQYLPIRSPSLTPGPVEARQEPTRLMQPLFLVGADPESLRWLDANRERLKQLNAVGMLVQAETEAELKAVTEAAHGLPLIPASGEAFAQPLGLTHYPVLITREGVEP